MAKMYVTPSRGGLREGLSFGYVDVPAHLTAECRPFLDSLTEASLNVQKETRIGREVDIKTEDVIIPAGGFETKVRIFIPEGEGPFPIALYCHGGGFAIRDVDCFDYIGRYLAKNAPAVVFMTDYVLAPENPYPAQLNQCWDTLLWAREHAKDYNGIAEKDVVLGDSAGGNLSAAICLKCKDEGVRQPAKQILIYPVVDAELPKEKRESETLYGTGYNLDYKHMVSYNEAYASADQVRDKYVSPLFAEDLTGLADCFMISAECDILIDQGMEYLQRLSDAGVKVDYKIFKGVPHDFIFFAFDESYAAYDLICDLMGQSFFSWD